jgi:hypothetical protein
MGHLGKQFISGMIMVAVVYFAYGVGAAVIIFAAFKIGIIPAAFFTVLFTLLRRAYYVRATHKRIGVGLHTLVHYEPVYSSMIEKGFVGKQSREANPDGS